MAVHVTHWFQHVNLFHHLMYKVRDLLLSFVVSRHRVPASEFVALHSVLIKIDLIGPQTSYQIVCVWRLLQANPSLWSLECTVIHLEKHTSETLLSSLSPLASTEEDFEFLETQ